MLVGCGERGQYIAMWQNLTLKQQKVVKKKTKHYTHGKHTSWRILLVASMQLLGIFGARFFNPLIYKIDLDLEIFQHSMVFLPIEWFMVFHKDSFVGDGINQHFPKKIIIL